MAEETNTNAPTLEQRIEQLEHEIARLRGGPVSPHWTSANCKRAKPGGIGCARGRSTSSRACATVS